MKPTLVCTNKFASRVEKKAKITCILNKDGSLNLRETEKELKRMFFDELGEVVKVRIRR